MSREVKRVPIDFNWPIGVVYPKIPLPKGRGYQMWETCSEGSPISPVFETPELLARWLADNNASAFGDQTASYDHWLGMITSCSYAPTMVLSGNKIMSGVEMVAKQKSEGK